MVSNRHAPKGRFLILDDIARGLLVKFSHNVFWLHVHVVGCSDSIGNRLLASEIHTTATTGSIFRNYREEDPLLDSVEHPEI